MTDAKPPESAEELRERYAKGERGFVLANLAFANLARANLDGANLDGANLAFAYLAFANLDGANLARANLARANLARANLDGANLDGANLAFAYLAFANLDGANLDGANLDGANLDGANLDGANLDGANLDGADGKMVIAGQPERLGIDHRGYELFAWPLKDGNRIIRCGCRTFTLEDARAHWGSDEYPDRERGEWFLKRLGLLDEEGA